VNEDDKDAMEVEEAIAPAGLVDAESETIEHSGG
jgi:hypothetical protein